MVYFFCVALKKECKKILYSFILHTQRTINDIFTQLMDNMRECKFNSLKKEIFANQEPILSKKFSVKFYSTLEFDQSHLSPDLLAALLLVEFQH